MSTVAGQQRGPSSGSSKFRKFVGRLRSNKATPDASAEPSPAPSRAPSFRMRTPRASPSPAPASPAAAPSHHRPGSAAGHEATAAASLDLWNAAYDALRDDPGCAGLVTAYETIVSQELPDRLKLGGANSSFRGKTPKQRRELLSAIAAAGLRKRRSSGAGQGDDDAARCALNAAKRAVEGLWPAYPATAVAWAGFCTLTPLLLDPIMQRADIRAGLVHVVGRIPWYMHLAQLPAGEPQQRETLVRLYRRVLEFEMNCVCATASAWNAAARHVVGWAGLAKLTQRILEADDVVAAMVARHAAVELGGRLLELDTDLDMSSSWPGNEDDEQRKPADRGSRNAT